MDALWEKFMNRFSRQVHDIVCTQVNPDGTMTSFKVNGEIDIAIEAIAGRLGTSGDQVEQMKRDGYVVLCKSSLFKDVNHVASKIIDKPLAVRGPAYVVRQNNPALAIFDSCEPQFISQDFDVKTPTAVVITMDTSESVRELIPAPTVDIQQVLGEAIDAFKKKDTEFPQERVVIDGGDDDISAGRRGLPVRRATRKKKKNASSRRRERDEEEDEEGEVQPRRSSRLSNKKR